MNLKNHSRTYGVNNMAKTKITVESDFSELVNDLLLLAQDFPEVILEAANAQMEILEPAIKVNWASMVPWGAVGDYVYDSIGYNTEYGTNKIDVVGMAGVFLVDSVSAKHGKDTPKVNKKGVSKAQIKAPQLAYWAEFGYTPKGSPHQAGVPFISNAYHVTLNTQESVFADTLQIAINKRRNK